MPVHILLGSWRFSLTPYLFKCLANFGAEWKSKLVYFVRLFFMADFLLVLGETPPSDPACRRENKKLQEPKKTFRPSNFYPWMLSVTFDTITS